MKNFLRALRHAWPYRRRLMMSIICATLAAVFWSLNFTAIYPVLKILGSEDTPQEWIEGRIHETQDQLDKWRGDLDIHVKEAKQLDQQAESAARDKRLRDVTASMAKLESRLAGAQTALWRYQTAKRYIVQWLPDDRFKTLAWVIGLVVAAVAIKGFFEFWQESLVGSVVNLSLYDLRNRFYRNVMHLDVQDFTEQGTHELMARFTNDMELFGQGAKTLFGKVIQEPLKALGCVVVAMWISWQLTLMVLVLVPIAVFVLTKVGRVMKRATRRLLERMSNIYKILQESFQGIHVVKAFTMEPYERRRFHTATRDYYHKAMLVVNIDALASPIIELLGTVTIAAALLAGAYLVLEHRTHLFGIRMIDQPLEMEGLLTLYGLLAAIADPVRKLSSVYTRLQSGAAAADRIYAYLDRRPRVQPNSNCERLARHQASLEFREICFSYEPGRPVLTNVTLTCRHGEIVALVGKNGCGKTTLLGLIPRLFDPDHGSILIDGRDVRNVNLRSLRQQIGLVTQKTTLFDDTIHNNISYGNRRAKREDVERAAKQARIHDDIMKLAQGYDTRVGEAASKLSGGQQQRIAFARAVLRDPSILILDEFTSQFDAVGEAEVHEFLRDFKQGRTTFVITHHMNTLEIADRIVVMDGGRIIAIGKHEELMHSCQVYQRLNDAHILRRCA
ncbi:MAG: ABC transporter ATP-binding protein/permease [Gemmataceae bacterium]|nr:ABC transporter ATP-binding protein/permease [Gemmataceae bacterium]